METKNNIKRVVFILLSVIFLISFFVGKSGGASVKESSMVKQEEMNEKKPAVEVEIKEVAGKTVMVVATEKTSQELAQLTDKSYEPNESLVKPVIMLSEKSPGVSKLVTRSGKMADVQIPKAKISVVDGTKNWDPTTGNPDGPTSDANAGRDSSATNGVVRSWDQITYLLDFSIQNMNMDATYTNIKYQVTATLPNAVTMMADGTTPQINGEIANGQLYKRDGTPVQEAVTEAGYSEGIMESSISDTGQVFIPIVVNVFGAPNGQRFQPTFQVKIVSADKINEDGTTETVIMDETYDNSDFSSLKPTATAVTAKPSVKVRLVKGETSMGGSIFGLANENVNSYNIGAVNELSPLMGRQTGDFRGAGFPNGPITYQIKQRATMTLLSGEVQDLTTENRDTMMLVASAVARNDRNQTDWNIETGWSMDKLMLVEALAIPNGSTKKIYTSQPVGERSKIGVYDSGITSHTNSPYISTINNSEYRGLENPYTYTMRGNRYSSTNKPFSSLEFVFHWDSTKTYALGLANNWQSYMMDLYVDSITYDGITTSNSTSVTYNTVLGKPGGHSNSIIVQDRDHNNLGDATEPQHNSGNARIKEKQELWFCNIGSFGQYGSIIGKNATRQAQSILMWDPTGFEYDMNRTSYYDKKFTEDSYNLYSKESIEIKYGVAKVLSDTPNYTMKIKKAIESVQLYDWYTTPEEAKLHGEISSVHFILKAEASAEANRFYLNTYVPVITKAQAGSKSLSGNPLTLLGSRVYLNKDEKIILDSIIDGMPRSNYPVNGVATFEPTIFNSSGVATSRPTVYWNQIGESMYVEPFSIRTRTDVLKNLYDTDEEIGIRVNGILDGTSVISYDSALNTTLPIGISYKTGTSTDSEGVELPEPLIKKNSNGTTTLRWTFSKIADIKKGIEVNFKADIDLTKLDFNDTSVTEQLEVKTVGEVWETDNIENKDNTTESVRSSFDTFRVKLNQQLVLTKKIDKKSIEVGTVDPANSEAESSTDITYTVTVENNSIQDMTSLKLLDVLPYNGDSRKTSYNGDYRVQSVTATLVDSTEKPLPAPAKSKLFYTVDSPSSSTYDEKSDPNTISGWTEVTAGNPVPSDAKGMLVEATDLPTGGKIVLTITIRPNGKQKAGDVYRNNARLNSVIDNPVTSQVVETKVYARDFTGYVWYDDDYDGLIGNKSDGSPEDSVENIPVKLYRTSLEDTSYVNELVKESLTGEKFIDFAGDSLIKTDANGKYKFENLPEGKYIAEFMVDDLVVQKIVIVTKQFVGSDDTKNSKADPNNYKTPNYKQPKLAELPALLLDSDKVYHITDVNAGLTRLSKIRLFKYEEGSVIDSHDDGELSEAEIESSGKPLKNAEFDLYKGNSTNEADKIGSAKTNDRGWLEYPGLLPGDYTIVETKAPDGFELLKDPVKVTVATYNSIIKIYVSDNGQTKLPFTGGTKILRLMLIVSASLMLIGMAGLFLNFRPIKTKGGN